MSTLQASKSYFIFSRLNLNMCILIEYESNQISFHFISFFAILIIQDRNQPLALRDIPIKSQTIRFNEMFMDLFRPCLLQLDWNQINSNFEIIVQAIVDFMQQFRQLEQDMYEINQNFDESLSSIFTNRYIYKQRENQCERESFRNWKQDLKIYWNITMNIEGILRQRLAQFQSYQSKLKRIHQYHSSWNHILIDQDLLFKQYQTPNSLNACDSDEIAGIKHQLMELAENNAEILSKIQVRINSQMTQNNKFNYKDIIFDQINEGQSFQTALNVKRIVELTNKEELAKYITYQIKLLQKEQIAESISKIISKSQEDNRYIVSIESALSQSSISITTDQLNNLNKLRQTSLHQFYQLGIKSKFNYTCHNYLAFNKISRKQTKMIGLEDQMMRGTFMEMQMCHQCKLIYQKQYLNKCQYRCKDQGNPKNCTTYYDPYIFNILKHESNNPEVTKRIKQTNAKNIYLDMFKDGVYYCNRFYCNICLRSYPKSKSPFVCPFCEGICNCTRCLRNNTIEKFKTISLYLGSANSRQFNNQKNSELESRLINEQKNTQKQPISRKSLLSYKMQLEQLRLLANMVKRRQVLKADEFESQKELFEARISLFQTVKI